MDGDVFELGEGGPRVRVEMPDGATIVAAAPPAEALPPPPRPPAAPAAARPPGPGSKLRLTFTSGTREGSSLELAGSVFRMGRAQECAVWTPSDTMVSGQHAKVVRLPTGYVLIDLESTNGTYLNGRRIQRATLSDGDVVGLGAGGPQIRVQILSPERAAVASAATISIPRFAELAGRKTQGARVEDHVLQAGVSALGRDPAADIHLDSPIVSRLHARLSRRGDVVTIEDLDSANGTYLNGRRITRSEVAPGDLLVVGPFQLVIDRAPATDDTGAPAPRDRRARHPRPRPARRPRGHGARGRPGDPAGHLALHRSRLLRGRDRPVRLRQVDAALGPERHPRRDRRRRAPERRRPPPRVRRLEVPARVRAPGRHRPSGADRRGEPRLHRPAAPAAGHPGRGARQARGRRAGDAGAHGAPRRAHPSLVRRPAQAGLHRDRAPDRAQPDLPGRAHQRPRPRARGSADAAAARAELQGQDGRAGDAHPRPHRPVRLGGAGDGRPAGLLRARRRGQGALRHRPHRQSLHAAQGEVGRGVERGLHRPRARRPRGAGEARGPAGCAPPAGRGARSGSSRS